MPKIRLKNTSKVLLGTRRPTEEFTIEVDDDGVPLDSFWRKRFAEDVIAKGYLTVITPPAAPPVAAPEPSSTPSAASPEAPKPRSGR